MTQVRDLTQKTSAYKRKLATRMIILSLSAFFVAQVVPTLAEEQDRAVELTEQLAPTSETTTAEVEPEPTPEPASDTATVVDPSPTPSASASARVYPARPAQSQGMIIKVPTEISVDPRAQIVRIPRISVTGPEYLLVCLNTVNTVIDVLTIGAPDNANATNLFIQGDLSSTLTIAAPTTLFDTVFNTSGGAKVSALGRTLAGQRIEIGFLATDKLANSDDLCGQIAPENRRTILLKALGVGLGLKKGEVILDR